MTTILSRSRENALIGGVCSGLAVFLGVSPTLVRLFFFILVFGHGIGIVLYLMLWIMIPLDGQVNQIGLDRNLQASVQIPNNENFLEKQIGGIFRETQGQFGILFGFILIFIGVLYLLSKLRFSLPDWLDFDLIWPLLLLFGGLALLIRRPRGVKSHD